MRSGPVMELHGKRGLWEPRNMRDTSNRRKLERALPILYLNKYKSQDDPQAHMYRTNPKEDSISA